jgi:hypothetical protein
MWHYTGKRYATRELNFALPFESGVAEGGRFIPHPTDPMKRLSTFILSLAALGLLVQPAFADDASQRALASQLIDLLRGKDTMRQGIESVFDNVIESMHQHGMPQAGVDEIKAAVDKWYDAEINFEDIRPKVVDVYVKTFTEDDLKQIIGFYQTPAGEKMLKEMPDVMKTGAAIAQDYTKAKIPDLNAALTPILTKYRDQMGAAPGSGAGAPPAN